RPRPGFFYDMADLYRTRHNTHICFVIRACRIWEFVRDQCFAPKRVGHAKEQIMNIEKYSERVRGFIQSAQSYALAEGHQQFVPEHLLKVLMDDDQGMASSLIERAGGRPADVRLGNDAALAKLPKVSGGNGQLYLSQPIAKVFQTAED